VNISLTPELEEYVEQKLKAGDYRDPSQVMNEALHLMKERDEERQRKLEDLRREIAIGLEQAERGESAPLDIEATIAEARRQRASR
jgi:antitoxin ParD1/3/4